MPDSKNPVDLPDLFGKVATVAAKALGDLFLRAQPGKAISAAEMLSERLRRALLTKMVTLSRNKQDDLFDGYGPLSTFAARIDISYALGLIDEELRVDLKRIQGIRNDFAHTEALTFENPIIEKRLREFGGFKKTGVIPALENEHFFTEVVKDIVRRLNASPGEPPQLTSPEKSL